MKTVIIFLLCLFLSGCINVQKYVDGRPVVGITNVNGRWIYILGEKEKEKEDIKAKAEESRIAAENIIFAPTK